MARKKIYPAIAIGSTIIGMVCMISGKGYLFYRIALVFLCVALVFLCVSLRALNFKEIIDFVHNIIRFDSNDFDIISNFIYNKLIKKKYILGGAFSAIYFKRALDFFYNRVRFESADFNNVSNFIYNKFIQKRN